MAKRTRRRSKKSSKKSSKGQISLRLLEKRLARLGAIVRSRKAKHRRSR